MLKRSALPFIVFPVMVMFRLAGAQDGGVIRPATGFVLLHHGKIEITTLSGQKRTIERNGETESASGGETPPLEEPVILNPGDSVETDGESICNLILPDAGTMRVQPGTAVQLPEKPTEKPDTPRSLELLRGRLFLSVDAAKLQRSGKQFRLKTPTTVLAVKGTRFFAGIEEGIETAGVHEGEVALLEAGSGKFASIKKGMAVSAKPGAITQPRRLTPEEAAESEIYNSFGYDFVNTERASRKYSAIYDVFGGNTAIPTNHEDLIEIAKTEERFDGIPALKMTLQSFKNPDPQGSIRAQAKIEVNLSRLRTIPAGLSFSVRADGIQRFNACGQWQTAKGETFGIDSRTVFRIPPQTAPGEWVAFYAPVKTNAFQGWSPEMGSLYLWVNPGLQEGRAVESIIQVDPGRTSYSLEISPVQVAVPPK